MTSWELPSKRGKCNWFLCQNKSTYGGFCEEHGGIEVKVTVVDEKDRQTKKRRQQHDGKNKGYRKTYS